MIKASEFITTTYDLVFDDGEKLKISAIKDYNQAIDLVCERLQSLDQQSSEDIERWAPYFGHIWPSCLGLVRAISDINREAVVLELGCGLAIPSLYLKKKGVKHVHCLDSHPLVQDFLTINQELNSVQVDYKCQIWSDQDILDLDPDVIMAADVLYEYQQVYSLSAFFLSVCQKSSKKIKIFVADPGRSYLQKFFDEMKSLGFQGSMDILRIREENNKEQDIFILKFLFAESK
jgi:predicted nicotinamide N-methyase